MNDCSFIIADCFSTGAENAKTTKYLARTYNLTSREIQLMIEAERRAGALICSNSHGYYIAASMAEVSEWVTSMQHRIKVMESNCNAVMKAALRTFCSSAELPSRSA